jgi:hypothetical protein
VDGSSLRTIKKALKAVGDKETLAALLGISVSDVETYLLGGQVPHQVFVDALDIVSRDPKKGGRV